MPPTDCRVRVCAETVYLIVAAVAGTIAAGSFVGFLVRSEGTRVVRRMQAAGDARGKMVATVPGEPDSDVTRLPSPDLLRAARNLARKVIASEGQRVEDNPEDTTGFGKRRNGSTRT